MSGFENWPAPILRRWLLSAAAGPVIFLIGLAGRIALHDPTLLTLSSLLASCIVVRALKVNAVTAANQKSLTTIQQEVMRSAGFIHQPDTLVTSQGRSPDSDTHALHRFIGPLTDRLKQQNTSNDYAGCQ